jgi:hypothetical protein
MRNAFELKELNRKPKTGNEGRTRLSTMFKKQNGLSLNSENPENIHIIEIK